MPCALDQAAPAKGMPVGEEKSGIDDLDTELLSLGKKLGEIVHDII